MSWEFMLKRGLSFTDRRRINELMQDGRERTAKEVLNLHPNSVSGHMQRATIGRGRPIYERQNVRTPSSAITYYRWAV